MKLPAEARSGVVVLSLFFLLVLGIAFIFRSDDPVGVVAGEDSVGTWMSGVLLTISATICGLLSMKRSWYPWMIFCVFFMLLAIDEDFMIHESMKRWIIFSGYNQPKDPEYWMGEIPVVLGAVLGAVIASILWKNLNGTIRWLVPLAVLLGIASVVIDVMAAGALWEDSFKLLAEWAITSALVAEIRI